MGSRSSLDGGLSELCDAAAEVTRGAPLRVMDCVESAVARRLCAGSEVETKPVVVIVGGGGVVPAGSGPRLSQCPRLRRHLPNAKPTADFRTVSSPAAAVHQLQPQPRPDQTLRVAAAPLELVPARVLSASRAWLHGYVVAGTASAGESVLLLLRKPGCLGTAPVWSTSWPAPWFGCPKHCEDLACRIAGGAARRIRTVDKRDDIAECVRRVSGSLRAAANVLTALSGLVRSGAILIDGKWAPAVRALVDVNRVVRSTAERDSGRRRR